MASEKDKTSAVQRLNPEVNNQGKRKFSFQCIWRVLYAAVTRAFNMLVEMFKSHCRRGHESYEEKYERRQEKREFLGKRNNLTMCRLLSKQQNKELKLPRQSPRQTEFLRRRNLISEEPRRKEVKLFPGSQASLLLEDHQETCGMIQHWTYPKSSLDRQFPWNSSISHLHSRSAEHGSGDALAPDNLNFLSQNKFTIKVNKSCKGTQTATDSDIEKKNSGQQTDGGTAVLDKEIMQLSNYLNEALHRELMLKQKMMILQELLATLLQAAEKSWKDQFNEDQMKCRLRILENQLQTCTQSYSKRSLKRILMEMEDQKQDYEQKAKESLQKLLEEKLQVERQLQNVKVSLQVSVGQNEWYHPQNQSQHSTQEKTKINMQQRVLTISEEDCILWKEHYNLLKDDWSQLTDKHIELENKLHVLENKLQWSDTQNAQLLLALQNSEIERNKLYSRIDILQEDYNLTTECICALESKLKAEALQKLALEATVKHLQNVIQNQSEESQAQHHEIQRKEEGVTVHSGAPNPAKTKDHKVGNESSQEDQLKMRTSQFTAKQKESLKSAALPKASHFFQSQLPHRVFVSLLEQNVFGGSPRHNA